jgi:uncharacterized protein (TIGR02271 family)
MWQMGPMLRNERHDETHELDDNQIVIPLVAEEVSIDKRKVVTGRVEIATMCHQREELVDELLAREQVEIERTPVGRPIEQSPGIREEGDTIVIPVLEEVLVVERRLILKEEIRIRRVRGAERHQERVNVRRQDVVVTRHPRATGGAAESPAAGVEPQTRRKEK